MLPQWKRAFSLYLTSQIFNQSITMRAIILHFPKPPCQEKWDNMHDNDLGKHCPVCKTDIFDFSDLTDDELVEILKYAPAKICGKFRASQLDRAILIKEGSPVSRNPRFKTMLAATMMLAVTTPFLNAQDTIPLKPVFTNVQAQTSDTLPQVEADTTIIKLRGKVFDPTYNEPLVGVAISTKGYNSIGAVSNLEGEFELKIPLRIFKNKESVMIQFNYVGYIRKEIEYILAELEEMDKLFSKVEMKEDDILIGEIIIIQDDFYDPIYGRGRK